MRFTVSLLLLVCGLQGVARQQMPFNIEGQLNEPASAKYACLLVYPNTARQTPIFLQAAVKAGKFSFTGKADTTGSGFRLAEVFLTNRNNLTRKDIESVRKEIPGNGRRFVVETKVDIRISSSVSSAGVLGTLMNRVNDKLEAIANHEKRIRDSLWIVETNLRKSQVSDKEQLLAECKQQTWLAQDIALRGRLDLVKQYPTLPQSWWIFSASVVQNRYNASRFQDAVEEAWLLLPAYFKQSAKGKEDRKLMDESLALIALNAGDRIPDYTFRQGQSAEAYPLQSFRGKYLLIDFWTSWCTPCRAEHYYMKKAFEKYRNKNFAILQVSLDSKEAAWQKASAQDNLPWLNLHHAKGWDPELEKVFNFSSVPTNYLVGPEGTIVARNLRGEALEKMLDKLIKN